MRTVSGSVGSAPAPSQSAGSVFGARPTSVAIRLRSAAICDSMVGIAASVSCKHRLRPLGVERRAAPGRQPVLGERNGATLVLRVASRDSELLLGATQLEVRARHLGGERHLNVLQTVLGRRRQRTVGVNRSVDAAEHVELPRRVEANVVQVLLGQLAR